jgi:hypothetical protein
MSARKKPPQRMSRRPIEEAVDASGEIAQAVRRQVPLSMSNTAQLCFLMFKASEFIKDHACSNHLDESHELMRDLGNVIGLLDERARAIFGADVYATALRAYKAQHEAENAQAPRPQVFLKIPKFSKDAAN